MAAAEASGRASDRVDGGNARTASTVGHRSVIPCLSMDGAELRKRRRSTPPHPHPHHRQRQSLPETGMQSEGFASTAAMHRACMHERQCGVSRLRCATAPLLPFSPAGLVLLPPRTSSPLWSLLCSTQHGVAGAQGGRGLSSACRAQAHALAAGIVHQDPTLTESQGNASIQRG